MSPEPSTWRQRIARLSPAARALLRDQLAASAPPKNTEPRLVVVYTPAPGADPAAGEILQVLEARLPPAMVPREFLRVASIPRLPNGKVDRRRLAAVAQAVGEARALPGADTGPASPLEQRLADTWAAVLRRGTVGVADDFFDLGGDSIHAMQIVSRLKPELPGLTLAMFFRCPTVRGQAAALSAKAPPGPSESPEPDTPAGTAGQAPTALQATEAVDPVIIPLRSPGGGPPLVFVHGGADLAPFARHLDFGRPVVALRIPFELEAMRRAPHGGPPAEPTVEELAERYLALLRSRWPHGPFRLAGYCIGGWIASVMAAQLRAAGEPVEPLILIDSWWVDDQARQSMRRSWFRERVRRVLTDSPAVTYERLQRWVSARRKLRRLDQEARQARPHDDEAAQREIMIHLYISLSHAAMRRFRPAPGPGRALVLRAEGSLANMRSHAPGLADGRLWRTLFPEGVTIEDLPGNHDNLLQDPHAAGVAARIGAFLDATRSEAAASGT